VVDILLVLLVELVLDVGLTLDFFGCVEGVDELLVLLFIQLNKQVLVARVPGNV
jgi:hypothetical protein